ncbi:MAG: 30S ribosomal protein S12 methylthiotransferase RimO, partial [Myxococcales bacterium]|nr:30S ribosomal protein S12 methylthiotransferase RimO [Myxococcales bacterium]
RIHFVSLGCAKNRVDTEIMLGVSAEAGLERVVDPAQAEVIVVNTCGFIGPAKEESIQTILELGQLREHGSCEQLVVTGCLSQRYAQELAEEMPEVDHFLGSSDMLRLEEVLRGQGERMMVGDPMRWVPGAADPRVLTQSAHSAFLKIAEGCNRSCAFCAIPAIRGKQRSRPIADVVAEARRLAAAGVVELCLVSQDTVAYGRDLPDRPTLAALVRAVADVPGIRWLRLHYLYPETLDEALIELLATHPVVLPYIDMPLQHASESMLRRMRRGHGGERLYRLVDRLRDAIPDLVFRTAFIVGHPGETEEDFEALQAFLRYASFDHVGVFRYSHEEGTASHEMGGLVDEDVAAAREQRLMATQQGISRDRLAARIGTELEVLVEGLSEQSELLLEGRYWGQAPEVDGKVILANGEARPGQLRRALVRDAGDYDLVADLLDAGGAVDLPPDVAPVTRRRVTLPVLGG